ncbi:hypothetical protein [Halopiger aswanensis]|nr:hypothetical protein [Halopiger aswanensis]
MYADDAPTRGRNAAIGFHAVRRKPRGTTGGSTAAGTAVGDDDSGAAMG